MKLKQVWKDSRCCLAIESPNGWVDVAEESSRLGIKAPSTMLEAILAGEKGMAVLKQLAEDPRVHTGQKVSE